jgi:hypothetical protein
MTHAALPAQGRASQAAPLRLSVAGMQRRILWLFIACSALASIEPSPYEIFFLLALMAFGLRGLLFDRAFIPLIVGLALYNVGGVLALVPFVQDHESTTFVAISVYIAVTAVFFAALIAKSPLDRMRTIRSGYVAAGVIASFFAIVGYFNIAGMADHFTLYGRASGTFKDPNVLGSFIVPPIVFLTQDIMLGRVRIARAIVPLLVILTALLLSFSRGSWGVWVGSTAMMVALTFFTTGSANLRQRIVTLSVVGLIGVAILLAIALSIPAIREVFEIRATLNQDYDLGELGRFGAQLRAIPLLLERPFGFGPLQFHTIFTSGVDPHEVYLNAFASYGWIGGLSFIAFTAATCYVGCRVAFLRSAYQTEAIAVWSCLFVQMVQGFQIDTDHWRHLYLLFGALYGLAAAARRGDARAHPAATRQSTLTMS